MAFRQLVCGLLALFVFAVPACKVLAQGIGMPPPGFFGGMMMGGAMMGGPMMGGFNMGGMFGGGAGAGVVIRADGVLKDVHRDPTGALTRKRFMAARKATREFDRSDFRKVSLNRLEAAVKERLETGETITPEMTHLAGLTRIEYVMLLPESGDILIAGPAEPGYVDADGAMRGVDSGRPSLHLQDLIVAMRAFPPGGGWTHTIGCSIDPTAEGLANMQKFAKQVARRRLRNPKVIVNGLKQAMGRQVVTVNGVSPETHFARVMVAADYRMKLITIGVEKPPVKISSYVDLSSGRRADAIARMYFAPHYETVVVSDDHLAMQIKGNRVKVVGVEELASDSGERLENASVDPAFRRFTEGFTEKFPELAAKEPLYAQLRNLIDLSIAAAFLQKEDYYGKTGHRFELFISEEALPVEIFHAPKQVDTVVTAVWKGSRLVTPMGGGVCIQPRLALEPDNLLEDEQGQVDARRRSVKLHQDGRWWWD
jgi:hypothetical protein